MKLSDTKNIIIKKCEKGNPAFIFKLCVVYLWQVKNIAYILLFCFAISFVQKANACKSSYAKYEKQIDQNEQDSEDESETDGSEDNNKEENNKIESEDKYCEDFYSHIFSGKLDLIENNSAMYFHAYLCFFKSPSLSIFAPPPNA